VAENQIATVDRVSELVYPSIDSCLSITAVYPDKSAVGAHLVVYGADVWAEISEKILHRTHMAWPSRVIIAGSITNWRSPQDGEGGPQPSAPEDSFRSSEYAFAAQASRDAMRKLVAQFFADKDANGNPTTKPVVEFWECYGDLIMTEVMPIALKGPEPCCMCVDIVGGCPAGTGNPCKRPTRKDTTGGLAGRDLTQVLTQNGYDMAHFNGLDSATQKAILEALQ